MDQVAIQLKNDEEIRPHQSYSSISEYLCCPLKFYFHRIRQYQPESTSLALVFGKTLHIVYAYIAKLMSSSVKEPIALEEMENFFVQIYSEQENEQLYHGGKNRDEILDMGKHCTKAIIQHLGNKEFQGKEVWIERKFIVPLQSDNKFFESPLSGILDLVVIDHEKQHVEIVEFKTSSARYPKWKIRRNLQMLAYVYAMHQILGQDYRIVFRWEVLLKQKTPKFVFYDYLHDEQDFAYFLKTIEMVEKSIDNGIFYPTPSYFCSFCEFYKACQKWPALDD